MNMLYKTAIKLSVTKKLCILFLWRIRNKITRDMMLNYTLNQKAWLVCPLKGNFSLGFIIMLKPESKVYSLVYINACCFITFHVFLLIGEWNLFSKCPMYFTHFKQNIFLYKFIYKIKHMRDNECKTI